jgi:hypothetical protein
LSLAELAAHARQFLTPTKRLELDNQWCSIFTKLYTSYNYWGRVEIATSEEHPELWEPAYQESVEIIQKGASPQFLFSIFDGQWKVWGTPLHFAVRGGYEGLIRLLVSYGADLNDRSTSTECGKGATSLHVAASPETRALDTDFIIDLLVTIVMIIMLCVYIYVLESLFGGGGGGYDDVLS